MTTEINPFRSPALSGVAVVLACFSLLNTGAQAADQLWKGSAGDHDVTTPSNWVGGAPAVDLWQPFVFGGNVADGTMYLSRWVAISSITLNSGCTHDISITGGGPIVMGGSLVDMSSAGFDLTCSAQLQQGWGDMTFNVGPGRTFTASGGVGEAHWFTYSGLPGATDYLHTGLTKTGAGTLNLTGPNDYTGPTTINGGMIWANYDAGSRIGSGPVTVGGNDSPNTSSFTIWANLGATLTNNFVLNSMGSAQNRGAINQDGGAGLVTLNGSITLAGDSRIGAGGDTWNSMVINGQISGPGKLYVWENTNTTFNVTQLTLNNGANNYSGGTVIEHGHLSITQGTPLGTGPVTVNSGATLALGSGTVTLGSLTLGANATLDLSQPLTAPADSVLQVNGNLVLGGNLAVGNASPGKVYAIHYTGALTNLGFTTSVIVAGKTVLVDTVSTPGQVLFKVGMLNPTAGQNVPMDLAAPLPLGWVPLLGATAYDVYLGTGSSAVAGATTTTAGIYQSRTNGMPMNIASLQPNTTYYWRVDGVAANGTLIPGTVYCFTTGAAMVDLMEDTWVATDALGRKLPGHADCGSPRTDRPIAMFYFLWHDTFWAYGDGGSNWDVGKILAAHPYTDPHNPWADNPIMQQVQNYFWWGEPEVGYYNLTDPWVLRHEITLLNNAGIDVLIFDNTNGIETYDTQRNALCDMIEQMRMEGQKINLKFACMSYSAGAVQNLYDTIYSQNKYSDLWYYWKGKPLMPGNVGGVSTTIKNFFTWHTTAANSTKEQLQDAWWQWIDLPTPQNWSYDKRSDLPEEMPVSCGGWTGDGRSKSNDVRADYDNQHLPIQRTSDQGIFFKEQINYGLKYDPQLLFITGWNEWIAASWHTDSDGWPNLLGNPCPKNGFFFVDCYNQEHSRDIEPMKGGHTDNYYFQMIGQNRQRKGVRPVPAASAPQTINLAGGFSQWDTVAPAYYDAVKDTVHRNYNAAAPGQIGTYTNTTGRNDLTVLKVARDANNFYFFAQCNSNITSYTDSNWMVLLIDADQNHKTGWEGYDYAVNLGARTATTTTLSQNTSTTNGWTWTPVRSDIAYTVSGNQLMLTIPRAAVGLGADPAQFDFHWADNFQTTDIADFGVNGDSAPDRRFNYRYTTTTNTEVTLLADDFESGKQSAWAETWTNGSRWDLTTASPYAGSTCAVGSNAASGQSDLIARASTAGYGSFRLNFHYKLADVRNAQTLQISYLTADGWVPIRQLSRDEFYPANQSWSYDEQQNVWLNFTDTRYNTGPDARFFSSSFAFRIDASALTGAGQQVFVDAVSLTANTRLPAAVSPQTWQTQDIGNAGNAGYVVTNSSSSFTVAGTGMDIGNKGDAFRFLYQTRTGDGTLIARVTGITPTDPWAKAGVMIRESRDVGARNALIALSSGNGVIFQQRTTALGATASTVVGPSVTPPYWVRMVRAGNALTGYVSTDGASWSQIGTASLSGFSSTALWGLAVTAHTNTLVNVATFDNVSLPPVAFTLTYQAGVNGTLSGTSPQTVNYGASGSAVTAVPNTGYHFVNWSDSSVTNPRTDVNVTGNVSVTANFAINTYTLSYTAGANGTLSGTSAQTVNYGVSGSAVTAVPNTGYHFVNWSDSSVTNPRADVNVTGNVSVTANFAINTYTLSYTAGANGTLSGTSPQTMNYGASGTAVTAVPNTGYHFVNWSDSSVSNPRTDVNVTGNVSVTANFAINTYTLSYTAGANGTLSGTSPQTVNYGASGSAVTAVPNVGYTFSTWSGGSTVNPRTDVNVTSNVAVTANFVAYAALTVTNLTVNNVSNPLGIDREVPLRFAWQMNSGQRSAVQTAYQVIVAATAADANNGVGSVWDSGKVMSDEQTSIAYGGTLSAKTRYFVRVKLWDKNGVESPWSAISTFETAMLAPSDWTAQWLGDMNAKVHYLRKEFQLSPGKTIDHARAYVGGAGTYVLRINGQKVSPNEYFLPMQTYFDTVKSRILYRTFDITSLLTAGTNAVGIILQDGFLYPYTERAICEMDVYYTDGTRDTVLSDNSWKALYNGGPYILTTPNGGEIYCAGETYDARQELTGWDQGGYNDLSWGAAPNPWTVGTQNGILSPQGLGEFICNWAGGTDYSLTAQFRLRSGTVELVFRSSPDCQNFYMWQLSSDGTLRPHKCVAGTYTVLNQVNIGAFDANWHNLTIRCVGSTITTFLDGVQKDTIADSTFTSGTVGIRGYWTDDVDFDSMTVTAAGGSPVLFTDTFDNLNNWPYLKKQPRLVAQVSGTIAYANITPTLINSSGTTRRYDIGANVTGFVELTATGVSGDMVTITTAESLNADGTLNRDSYSPSIFYARSIDTYTLKGGAAETYKPEFTAHGFRYFEITAPATTTISNVVVRVLGNSMPLAASFNCSTKVLNDLYQGYVYGQRDNSISFPTSCNNRAERHPYVLDAQVSERSAMMYFGAQGLYEKWLNDFLDGEMPNGFMGYIVPNYRGGNDPIWSAGTATLPWDYFAAYTDKEVMANYYPRAQRYVACLNAWAPTGIMYNTPEHTSLWTDWLCVNFGQASATELFLTLYYYRCVDAVKNMASALGKTADVAAYDQTLTVIRNAFNALYLHTDHYDDGQQAADAIALHFGLVPAASRAAVAAHLANNVINNGMHLTVGALGADSLLSALAENGYENIAYALATQKTYPSWGYMMEHGPGTYWESWGGGSLNHPMMSGGVARYVINCVGGIDMLAPGYKQIRIKPYTGGVETYASTRLATVRGDIVLNWTNTGSAINMDVLIPPNTTAQVYVPTTSTNAITESGVPAASSPGVTFSAFSNGCAIYNVGSGHYLFSAPLLSGNHYTAVTSGNFDTPTIWSPNGIPERNDSITIGSGVAVTLGGGSYNGTITNNGALIYGGSVAQTLGGGITGAGSITQNGPGMLTLDTFSAYTGTITVNGGTVQAPEGSWVLNNVAIAVNAGGTFTTSADTGYVNSLTLNGGTLSSRGVNDPGTWGNVMLQDGQQVTAGGAAVSTISANLKLFNTNFAVGAGSTLKITSMLSESPWSGGPTGLTKTGDGTLALSGANNYTGATTVNGGTLAFGSVAAVGNTSGITVNGAYGSGGHLRFGTGADGGTIITPISVVGGDYDWNMAVTVPNNLTFTGPINLSGAALIVSEGANSTLNFNNAFHGTEGLNFAALSGGKNFFVLAGASDFTGDFSVINWNGSPQVTLGGGDNRLPTTAVVRLAGATGSPAVLDLNGNNQTIAGLGDAGWGGADAGARHVVNTSSTAVTLTLNTTADQSSGATIGGTDINGTAGDNLAMVKTGAAKQTLTGANTYTGTTDVTHGTLALGASNVLPDGSHVTLGNATLDAATFTDTAGTLAIAGSGTIHLGTGSALAFADSHSVSWSGSLTLTGTFVSGASLRFGSNSSGLTSNQLATISAPGLANFALNPSGYLTASLAAGYAGWKAVNAPTGTTADDYDGDGVSNGVEFVIGGTKDTNDLSKQPAVSNSGANMVFTFQRAQASIDGTTTVAIQVGSELNNWPDSYNVPGTAQTNNPGVTVVKNTSVGFDTVTLTVPRAPDAKKFARLLVTPAP